MPLLTPMGLTDTHVAQLQDIPIVTGGDLYVDLDTVIDRSPPVINRCQNKAEIALKTLIKDPALTDIWRLIHPVERNST